MVSYRFLANPCYAAGVAKLSADARRRLLARGTLFAGLEPSHLDEIAAATRVQKLGSREELFHKGDQGSQVYVVVSGRLKALATSLEGDDVVFNILGPGEVFGEIALLGETPRTATVAAIEPCELLVIDRRDFLALLRRHPEAAIGLLRVLALRLKRVSELLEDTLFLNLPIRLAKKLLALDRVYGRDTEAGRRVDLKLSQEEWGDLVGTTRESINKQMRAWTEQGLISVDRGYVVIHRSEELEQLAEAAVF
jgi:CRP/FNR family cyclic AMP-dependent transcriptional regulator